MTTAQSIWLSGCERTCTEKLCCSSNKRGKKGEGRGEERRGEERRGEERRGEERRGEERRGEERRGEERLDRTGQDRTGQDRTGQERKGKERKGKERKGKPTKNKLLIFVLICPSLTSMGLFFLPTLLVCSFSGIGGALLTGGLHPKTKTQPLNQSYSSNKVRQ